MNNPEEFHDPNQSFVEAAINDTTCPTCAHRHPATPKDHRCACQTNGVTPRPDPRHLALADRTEPFYIKVRGETLQDIKAIQSWVNTTRLEGGMPADCSVEDVIRLALMTTIAKHVRRCPPRAPEKDTQ